MGTKHTLGASMTDGAASVTAYCISCSYSHEFSITHALVLWGPDATFPEIAQRARCRHCRQQASEAAPNWPLHPQGGVSLTPDAWRRIDTKNPNRFPPKH